jgi:GntR family transcriptional regulator
MLYRIDPANGLAIFDQIARQVTFAVAKGALVAGDLVPSVRELAQTLAVNPNTVARAYRDLQSNGVLEPLRGEGLRVSRSAPDRCRKERQRLLKDRLKSVVLECRQSGLSTPQLHDLVDLVLNETATAGAAP